MKLQLQIVKPECLLLVKYLLCPNSRDKKEKISYVVGFFTFVFNKNFI